MPGKRKIERLVSGGVPQSYTCFAELCLSLVSFFKYTAGASWISGNDAKSPKPCLSPRSSFDEDFIGKLRLHIYPNSIFEILRQHRCNQNCKRVEQTLEIIHQNIINKIGKNKTIKNKNKNKKHHHQKHIRNILIITFLRLFLKI